MALAWLCLSGAPWPRPGNSAWTSPTTGRSRLASKDQFPRRKKSPPYPARFYFGKQVRNATGMAFTEFVSRPRLEQAKNLLLNPHLRISEIAYAAGFQSQAHFARMFKRIVGQSPTDYRGYLLLRLQSHGMALFAEASTMKPTAPKLEIDKTQPLFLASLVRRGRVCELASAAGH